MAVMGCVCARFARSIRHCPLGEVAGAYDYWLAIKLSERGGFYFLPENVMRWCRHVNSATATASPDEYSGEIYIYETLAAISLKPPLAAYAKTRLAECFCRRAVSYLERG